MDDKINIFDNTNNFNKKKHVNSRLIYGKVSDSKPYITIAIPTYKRHQLLREAIDSAINQTNIPCEYEIIVVDNEVEFESGVYSETEEIVKRYNDERLLYYRNNDNLGMFGNWNRCIELARGEWVSFLHDDDIIIPDYLEKVYKLLKRKKNIGAIISNSEILISDRTSISNSHISISESNKIKLTSGKLERIFSE